MFVIKNLYDNTAHFIDMEDFDFFNQSLVEAFNIANVLILGKFEKRTIKESTPAVVCSTVDGFDKSESNSVDRIVALGSKSKRRFLIVDADFDTGEEELSALIRQKFIDLSYELDTKLILYPTASYPKKPRFRAVLFTEDYLHADEYAKAIKWLYDAVGMTVNDDTDLRMTTNRNLPVFSNVEQIPAVFVKEEGKLLNNDLWQDVKVHKNISSAPYSVNTKLHSKKIDDDVINYLTNYLSHHDLSSYEEFFKLSNSIAASVVCNGISYERGKEAIQRVSQFGSDQKKQKSWERENVRFLDSAIANIKNNPDIQLKKIVPLAIRLKIS